MEQRFIESGNQFAEYISQKYRIEKTDALIERCINYRYNMFCADCSDSYNITLREQSELTASMINYLESIGAKIQNDSIYGFRKI